MPRSRRSDHAPSRPTPPSPDPGRGGCPGACCCSTPSAWTRRGVPSVAGRCGGWRRCSPRSGPLSRCGGWDAAAVRRASGCGADREETGRRCARVGGFAFDGPVRLAVTGSATAPSRLFETPSPSLVDLEEGLAGGSARGQDGRDAPAGRPMLPVLSLGQQMGFQNGDIVHAVNELPLTTVQQVMEAYQAAVGTDPLGFELTRGGERTTLAVSLNWNPPSKKID